LTDTLYIHICIKHFGMANIKFKRWGLFSATPGRGGFLFIEHLNAFTTVRCTDANGIRSPHSPTYKKEGRLTDLVISSVETVF